MAWERITSTLDSHRRNGLELGRVTFLTKRLKHLTSFLFFGVFGLFWISDFFGTSRSAGEMTTYSVVIWCGELGEDISRRPFGFFVRLKISIRKCHESWLMITSPFPVIFGFKLSGSDFRGFLQRRIFSLIILRQFLLGIYYGSAVINQIGFIKKDGSKSKITYRMTGVKSVLSPSESKLSFGTPSSFKISE